MPLSLTDHVVISSVLVTNTFSIRLTKAYLFSFDLIKTVQKSVSQVVVQAVPYFESHLCVIDHTDPKYCPYRLSDKDKITHSKL